MHGSYQCPVIFGKDSDLQLGVLMAISPPNIRILFTNYDIITYFLNLASCSEHFISIKHRILATFNISKKNQSERLYAFKLFTPPYL
jgi:hypothetical protein